MTTYSIAKVGKDYVVCADDCAMLTLNSRRRAAQLVVEATGLLSAAESGADTDPAEATALPSPPREDPEVS